MTATLEWLTARGQGTLAVAAVRGAGADAALRAAFRRRGRAVARFEPGRMLVGELRGEGDEPADEVVLAALPDGSFEVSGHGGRAAAARIERALAARGVRVVEAPLPAAAREHAATWLAFRVLGWRDEGRLDASWDAVVDALVRPRRVVLAGAPNAGKSTLFNGLLDRDRAIVSPEPGTTRDVVEEACALAGVPVVLCDTAGVRAEGAADALERAGAERARRAAAEADIVVQVIDGAGAPPPAAPAGSELMVVTKADLARAWDPPAGAIVVSALTGEGIDELALAIATRALGRDPRRIECPR